MTEDELRTIRISDWCPLQRVIMHRRRRAVQKLEFGFSVVDDRAAVKVPVGDLAGVEEFVVERFWAGPAGLGGAGYEGGIDERVGGRGGGVLEFLRLWEGRVGVAEAGDCLDEEYEMQDRVCEDEHGSCMDLHALGGIFSVQ